MVVVLSLVGLQTQLVSMGPEIANGLGLNYRGLLVLGSYSNMVQLGLVHDTAITVCHDYN